MTEALRDRWRRLAWKWRMSLLFGLGLAILAGLILLFLPGRSLAQLSADLAVTAFGAGLGVFLAFYVNEQRTQRREERRRGEEQARLAEMLDAVRDEVEHLTDEAKTMEDRIAGGKPIYEDLHLSSATWTSHQDRILDLEERPSVRRDLVAFYDQVTGLRRLLDLYQGSWGIAIEATDIEASLEEVRKAQQEERHPAGEHARSLVIKEMEGRAETVVDLGSELLQDWPVRISLLQGEAGWAERP